MMVAQNGFRNANLSQSCANEGVRYGGLESGLGARSPARDLRVATPDGLRRSAFMEGFAVRTRVSGTVDLKAVGRKISSEGFARCDTGRLAPFRFYGRVRFANEGVRYGGLESGWAQALR
jgi:hypothetical protein